MKRITFTVSDEIHKALKTEAARKNTTIKDLFWEAMADMAIKDLDVLVKKVKKKVVKKS